MDDFEQLDVLEVAGHETPMPEQENPLRHVPEEVMRNLDDVVVRMEDQAAAADTAAVVAAEAAVIAKSNRISHGKALELARDVPEIMGSAENPTSYTTVPTSVNAGKAVQMLEASATASRDSAMVKVNELLDRAIIMAQGVLTKHEQDWASALGSFGMARSEVIDKCGDVPEQSTTLYVDGNKIGERLGDIPVTHSNAAEHGGSIAQFHKAIAPFASHTGSLISLCIFARKGVVVGETFYNLKALETGILTPEPTSTAMRDVTLREWLSFPANQAEDTVKSVTAAMDAVIGRMQTIKRSLVTGEGGVTSFKEANTLVQSAVRLSAIAAALKKGLDGIYAVTTASTEFYTNFLNASVDAAGTSVPAAERHSFKRTRRLF